MLVRKLVTDAWYLSGIVARGLETVSGEQITDGVEILNDFIAEQSADGKTIPYYDLVDITSVPGQEEYFIQKAILIDSITYTIGVVRYPMIHQSRYTYWGTGRVNNINSLPFSYYTERAVDGIKLFVYFKPDVQIDTFQVEGRFALAEVALDDELSLILDRFYTQYLKYSLARRLCDWYNVTFPEQKDATRKALANSVMDVNYMDFTRTTRSPLTKGYNFSYVEANLGKGWTPV